jgi:hypothetical protein
MREVCDNQKIDAVVVGGIGAGALNRLNQNGIKVYRAHSPPWLWPPQQPWSLNSGRFCDANIVMFSLMLGDCAH